MLEITLSLYEETRTPNTGRQPSLYTNKAGHQTQGDNPLFIGRNQDTKDRETTLSFHK